MGTLYQTDPMLRLIPADEMPAAFVSLPDKEQRWRGRLFLMTYSMHGHLAHAWFVALADDEVHTREMKALVKSTPDDRIMAALRGLARSQKEEQTSG